MKNLSYLEGRKAFWCLIFLSAPFLHPPAHASKLASQTYFQQANTISGTISDAAGTLPGVSVSIKGKPGATLSDSNGSFRIEASPGETLLFSFLGYAAQEIPVKESATFNILLKPDTRTLQEVTVNAGYYSVKEKERTGSISKIAAADIENQPVTHALAAMQGRMAGVNITQTTGVPGGGFAIQIRGLNSLRSGGNDPLYVIDGVPYSSESVGSFSTSSLLGGATSPLNSINPDNIESIEVLKDADATAIYGSRGSNGVVLVTTKKGRSGKTQLTAAYSHGTGRVTRIMDLMKTEQYLAMRREAYANDGITNYPANAYDINGAWDTGRYTDWQKELIGGIAAFTNLNMALSGGTGGNQFLLSGNLIRQTTVYPGEFRYKKGNVHASASHESQDGKFNISFSAGYTVQDNNQPYLDLTRESRLLAPNAPALFNEQGGLNWQNNTFSNPLRHLNGQYGSLTQDQSDASISDASYIRLKNIALTYDLPERWMPKVKCRLSLNGQNLATFTKFRGADPEFQMYDRLPPLKIVTTGIQLTF